MKKIVIILGIFFCTLSASAANFEIKPVPKMNNINKIEVKKNLEAQRRMAKCYSCDQDMDGNLVNCTEVACCPPPATK